MMLFKSFYLRSLIQGIVWLRVRLMQDANRKLLRAPKFQVYPRFEGTLLLGCSPWGLGAFLLYRTGPLPFPMACRKRQLKSETSGCFPHNSWDCSGLGSSCSKSYFFFFDLNRVGNGNQLACETLCGLIGV